jgi:hypothetical protein
MGDHDITVSTKKYFSDVFEFCSIQLKYSLCIVLWNVKCTVYHHSTVYN